MFFGLTPVDDHPCCRMHEVVESFFQNSIKANKFSLGLFPEWMRDTLEDKKCTLKGKFFSVYKLLHGKEMDVNARQAIYDEFQIVNRIEELCNGTVHLQKSVISQNSKLGSAIKGLMKNLYNALDLAVFRRDGEKVQPTHQLYSEFIKKNWYVCPFCGISVFKNRLGPRREDFDHYLHRSKYPFAAANMKNLVPTCGTCNQDFKKTMNILADGSAFYPYADIPPVKVEVDCIKYPALGNSSDRGRWVVKIELVTPDSTAIPKIKAWNRVYSVKQRLENEIQEFCEDWIKQVFDDHPRNMEKQEFLELIASERAKAQERSQRRMEPKQIVKTAFYDFMLTKADGAFLESFRWYWNNSCE